MSDYFSKFPVIEYQGEKVRDITRRIAFAKKNIDPMVLLPYTIAEKLSPEMVAYYYYGSVDYTWLILLANDLTDPYTDWPMDSDVFDRHLMEKYSDLSGEEGYNILAWLQSTNNYQNIVFFYKEQGDNTIRVSPQTFSSVEDAIEEGWSPMRIYDYESLLNEEKRNIQVVDSAYKDRVSEEFRTLVTR